VKKSYTGQILTRALNGASGNGSATQRAEKSE
jgi:hypothetical protein